MSESEIPSTEEIQLALDTPVIVPHACVCAYVRHVPYHLVQRQANPACTVPGHDQPGELEKERD